MENRSSDLLSRCTERLFRTIHNLVEIDDELRCCHWLLGSLQRQVSAIAGREATKILFRQAVLETSRDWPILEQMELTEEGFDTSALRQSLSQVDREIWAAACKAIVYRCLTLLATIAGESLVLAIVDQVEADLQGLGSWLATSQEPENP